MSEAARWSGPAAAVLAGGNELHELRQWLIATAPTS
jgi:hypothetical protein